MSAIRAVYTRLTPLVVDQNQPGVAVLEVKVEGAPTAVTLKLTSTGAEVALKDDGTGGDKVAGDGIYTLTLGPADLLYDFDAADVNRNFVGYLRLYAGNQQEGQYNIFVDILTADIPPVEITVVSPQVQHSEHLVNILDPGFFGTFSLHSITNSFYNHFGDDYDFLQVIYGLSHFENRHYVRIRNDIRGIGVPIFNGSAPYGSAGRLLGCTVFPLPTFFDGASPDYQHELGHHWVNFVSVPPLDQAIPHWPLSDLASGIMGWGTGRNSQGLVFNFDLVPVGSNFQLVPNNDPKSFTDLDLYLMGLLPASQVGQHFVFDNQNQAPPGMLLGPVTYVNVADIVNQLGARAPSARRAQKKFRVATILVSENGLLSQTAMRLYDHFAARAEGTQVVPYSMGLAKGQSNPFYLSTRGLGRLDARIKRHILVDASRDGGVWWFPQAGPFDPRAPHQGKALADYLRSLGHRVVELPRPRRITARLLAGYDIVIRAVGAGNYDPTEIAAYRQYVEHGGHLLLLAEHGPTDDLAASLGLRYEGVTRGQNLLSRYAPHAITQGVGPMVYRAGSGLLSWPAGARILGWLSEQSYLDLNNNSVQDPGEPSSPPVLGVMARGSGRIVFCGDANLWQAVPQPLVDNVMDWFGDP